MNDTTEITQLLYRYAEYIDAGDLVGAAQLFKHARIKIPAGGRAEDSTIDHQALLELWRGMIRLYADGTPRTRHVVTNAIVEINAGGTASSRSVYSVFQQVDGFPLQLIVMGRYHDVFERVAGVWRWAYRDYTRVDLVGDLSHHLKQPLRAVP
jgi:3-phenylpropionate/cinnamic acid dioxygenase small subunit